MVKIKESLKAKGVVVTELLGAGLELRQRWEDAFAGHLSAEEKAEIHLHDDADGARGFLWHLFSYERRDCLQAAAASCAFARQPKGVCYLFYQHADDALLLEQATDLSVSDLEHEVDIYAVDSQFTWTYVITHEIGQLGPYFYCRDQK